MESHRPFFIFTLFLLLCSAFVTVRSETAGLAEKCGDEFQKVVVCLEYATGKAATPTKDCCTSVKSIKDSKPECLCFLIQQTGTGSDKLKSMGIQEAKLLQLPSACNLQNASISNCPKLLGLSPGSPDAAIFSNNASSATPSVAATTAPKSPAPSGSYAARSEPSVACLMIAAILFSSLLLLPFSHT